MFQKLKTPFYQQMFKLVLPIVIQNLLSAAVSYAVPLGFIAAFLLDLPVLWVYFLLCTDEFVKWPWVLKHYKSGKWLNNITRDDLFTQEI